MLKCQEIMNLVYDNIKFSESRYPLEMDYIHDIFAVTYNYTTYKNYVSKRNPHVINIWDKQNFKFKYFHISLTECETTITLWNKLWYIKKDCSGIYQLKDNDPEVIDIHSTDESNKLNLKLLTLMLGIKIHLGENSFDLIRNH